jgi:glutamyl-tRNA synthetase
MVDYDQSAVKKNLTAAASSGFYLRQADEAFRNLVATFRSDLIEQSVRDLASASGVSPGKYIHPIRVAISGQAVGIGLFDLIELVGPERTHARIQQAVEMFGLVCTPPESRLSP